MTDLRRDDVQDEAGKTYAVYLADTVVVKPEGASPEVATPKPPSDWKEVAYYFKVRQSMSCRLCVSSHSCVMLCMWCGLVQDGEEESEVSGEGDKPDDASEGVMGIRKSARTEQVDFKAREEER